MFSRIIGVPKCEVTNACKSPDGARHMNPYCRQDDRPRPPFSTSNGWTSRAWQRGDSRACATLRLRGSGGRLGVACSELYNHARDRFFIQECGDRASKNPDADMGHGRRGEVPHPSLPHDVIPWLPRCRARVQRHGPRFVR